MSRAQTSSLFNSIDIELDQSDLKVVDILGQVVDILKSKTVYSVAMITNIQAFHRAILNDSRIDDLQNKFEQDISLLKKQIEELTIESKKN